MRKKSRLFLRILCYFLTFSVLIVIVGALSYVFFFKKQKDDFSSHIQANMASVSDHFTDTITTVSSTCRLFFANQKVIENLRPYPDQTPENKLQMAAVVSDLSHYLNFIGRSTVIDILVYADDQMVYYTQGASKSESFFASGYAFEDYSREDWAALLLGKQGMRILGATRLKKYGSVWQTVVPVAHTLYINGNRCAFVALLSVPALINRYYDSSVFRESEFAVLDASGRVVQTRLPLDDDAVRALSEMGAFGAVSVGGNQYDVVTRDPDAFGFQVYCLTPTDAVLRLNQFYLFVMICVCAGFVLIAVALSYVYSSKLYAPIRGLRQDLDRFLGTEDAREGDELKYITFRLSDIAKHTDSVEAQKRAYSTRYIKSQILELIDGRHATDDQALRQALHETYGFVGDRYACELSRTAQSGEGMLSIAHRSGLVITLMDGCRAEGRLQHDGLNGIAQAFEDAANTFVEREIVDAWQPFDRPQFMLNLRMRDEEAALAQIDELAARLNAQWPGYARAKEAVQSVYDAAIATLGEPRYRHAGALRASAYDYMGVLLSQGKVSSGPLSEFAMTTIAMIPQGVDVKSNQQLAQRVKAFIDLHYFQPLSLDIIAAEVGVSGKYISKVFKDSLNVNVSDYIAVVRIEHAKRLIAEDVALGAVAELTGIESRATFNRLFKKIEGMTPSEYKKQYG